MKKLFLGLSIAASSLVFSQQFGIKGGMNVSSISDDGYDDTKSKVGYYGGVFVNIPASESFSIQPEVIYNNLGSEVKLGNSYSRKLNLNYITVPVMFQYKATPQFYLEAGPEFGFLVSADSKTTWNNSTSTAELDKDNFNNFNMGVGLGAGFDITKNVGINARYVAGFSDVTKPSSDPSTNAKNKNNTFQVGLNFKF
jgi:opacity protein-like surface antigen